MQKKRWSDLSTMQRAGVAVAGIIQVGLLLAGLWDLAHRSAEEIRGDRRFWMGFMFVNWIGPIAYFLYGRRESPWLGGCRRQEQAEQVVIHGEAIEFDGPAVV